MDYGLYEKINEIDAKLNYLIQEYRKSQGIEDDAVEKKVEVKK